jgi:hypothetical protein
LISAATISDLSTGFTSVAGADSPGSRLVWTVGVGA